MKRPAFAIEQVYQWLCRSKAIGYSLRAEQRRCQPSQPHVDAVFGPNRLHQECNRPAEQEMGAHQEMFHTSKNAVTRLVDHHGGESKNNGPEADEWQNRNACCTSNYPEWNLVRVGSLLPATDSNPKTNGFNPYCNCICAKGVALNSSRRTGSKTTPIPTPSRPIAVRFTAVNFTCHRGTRGPRKEDFQISEDQRYILFARLGFRNSST